MTIFVLMHVFIRSKEELDSGLAMIVGHDTYMIDTETSGLSPHKCHIQLIQIGTKEHQLVIDPWKVGWKHMHLVRETIGNALVVGHNIKFDLKFLKWHLDWDFEDVWDTMIAERVIYAGWPMTVKHSLEATLKRRLKVKLDIDKKTRMIFVDAPKGSEWSEEVWTYSAVDVQHLIDIMELQRKDVKRFRLDMVMSLEMSTLVPLAYSEIYGGLKIDTTRWEKYIKVLDQEASAIMRAMNRLAGSDDINWNSPMQVRGAIHNAHPELELDSTSRETLEQYEEYEMISLILQYRKKSKFIQSFGQSLLESLYDGRMFTTYGLVATGRMSSSNVNVQQIPSDAEVRSMFIAREGMSLITADYGSQELVIIASNSREPAWLDALKNGKDLHSISASMLYGSKWTEAGEEDCEFAKSQKKCSCPKHMEMRDYAKAISFMLAYGGGAFALSKRLGITEAEAERLMDSFFSALPNIHDYLESQGKFACDYTYSVTNHPIKRKRFYPFSAGLSWGAINRRGKNSPIQGTAADQTKLALVNIHYSLMEAGYSYGEDVVVSVIVHDEIVVEAKDGIATDVAKIVKECMEEAGKVTLRNDLLKTKPNIGKAWKK